MSRPLIQIGDEIREMTKDEHEALLAAIEACPIPPAPEPADE